MSLLQSWLIRTGVVVASVALVSTMMISPAQAHSSGVVYRGTGLFVSSSHLSAKLCSYGKWQAQGEIKLSNGNYVLLFAYDGCRSKYYGVTIREYRVCSFKYSPAKCSSWYRP